MEAGPANAKENDRKTSHFKNRVEGSFRGPQNGAQKNT